MFQQTFLIVMFSWIVATLVLMETLEIKKFNKLFEEYDLTSEGWSKFKHGIEAGLNLPTNLLLFPKS